jgi:RNA polymerase sigma factor (sigma-70 family)
MRDKTTKVKQRAICGRDELLLVPDSKAAPQRGPTNISKTNFVGFPTPVPIYLETMISDLELLQDYTRNKSEESFTALVNRHLNLVYSAAFRQVRSPQLAEEVAQSAFTDLARNAGKFQPDTILTAWLYQVTRRTAIDVVRKESRRQLREQIATEMNTMNATAADWTHVEPFLDEAMHTLDETDRAAVLLRYFENKSFREVGQSLGTSEDAAQKRVSRAVERLREFLSKRGVAVGASGFAVVISANAVQAAPVGLAVTISTAAILAGTAVSTSTIITATKTIAMSTIQKTVITATLAIIAGAGIYEAHQASTLRNQVQNLQQQQAPLAKQIQQLQRERDNATNRLASLANEVASLKRNPTELLKLRGEVAQLRGNTPPQSNDPTEADMKSWLVRVNKLKQRIAETPEAKIPEFRFLSEDDYMDATKGPLNTEGDYLRALSNLRSAGEFKFISTLLSPALTQYAQANNGQFPTDLAQLQPYFPSPVEDAILERWEIAPANTVRTDDFGDPIITQKTAVDEDWDPRYAVGLKGFASGGLDTAGHNGWGVVSPDIIMGMAAKAYEAANNGQAPTDPSQILPYLTTPEQQAALQKIMRWKQAK